LIDILVMDSKDLFSFLSENAPEDDHDSDKDLSRASTLSPTTSTKKRKAEPPTSDTGSVHKKFRVQTAPPINSTPKESAESSLGGGEVDMVPPLSEDTTTMHDIDNESGPSLPRKPRMASPKPIVLDDFETEAKREVAASAGLTGSVDVGTRLELKHQVRYYYVLH
jgi:ATP-dependent RNA helicase DOB1